MKKIKIIFIIISIFCVKSLLAQNGISFSVYKTIYTNYYDNSIVDSNDMQLNFVFNSNNPTDIFFDIHSIFKYKNLETYKVEKDSDIWNYLKQIKYTELFIEDENGFLKPLSTSYYFSSNCRILKHFLETDEYDYDIIHLNSNKMKKYSLDIPIAKCCIKETKGQIRFWYYYKPTKKQLRMGFKSNLLISDWIKL